MNARTDLSVGYINLDRSFWTVLVPGDDSFTCKTEEEAHHQYRSLFFGDMNQRIGDKGTKARMLSGIVVIEFNPAESWSKDVTLDFADWGDEPDAEAEYAAARAHREWERDVTPRRL